MSWQLGRWMEDVGFDAKAYVRAQKAARRSTEPAGPSQKVLRLARRAAKELGVSFGDIAVAPHLKRGAVVIEMPPHDEVTSTEVWTWFRTEVARSRLWPVWVGEVDDEVDGNAQQSLAAAARLDPVGILRDRRTILRVDPGDRGLRRAAAGAEPATELGRARGGSDRLYLIPAENGWTAFAYLGWEDGGTFRRSQHVAVLRHFEQSYGAELARVDGATLELFLAAPLETDCVEQAALDRAGYGDATFGRQEMLDFDDVRAATAVDHVWGFWWD